MIDIKKLMLDELKTQDISNSPYINGEEWMKECIVQPFKKKFLNVMENTTEEYWVVFDEDKTNKEDGYLLFYSERDERFGIGAKTNLQGIEEVGTFIGIYGSFIDAIESM